MCRLMILSSTKKLTVSHYMLMTYMLALSERSGNTHGMGIGTNTNYLKFGENAASVVISREYVNWVKARLEEDEHTTLVGHTRLASTSFRGTANTEYSSDDAHPFLFGNPEESWGALYHNGTFKEHEDIAKKLNLEASHGLTDTALFAMLLNKEVGNKVPTTEDLFKVLEQCGKADYSMILTHTTTPAVTVLRGIKPLYMAQTNYGLMINTDQSNITDLQHVVNPGLALLDGRLLKVETPEPISIWTINQVTNGVFKKIKDIDKLKEISDPPYKHTETTARGTHGQNHWANSGYRGGYTVGRTAGDIDDDITNLSEVIHNEGAIDAKKVVAKAEAINSMLIFAMDNSISNEEIDRMFYDTYGRGSPWFTQDIDRITEMIALVNWIWEKYPETIATDEKHNDWEAWKKGCRKQGDFTNAGIYSQASKVLQTEFVSPWFLNSHEDLNTLVPLIAEIKYEPNDHRTA